MRERVELISGRLEIRTGSNGSTVIARVARARWPRPQAARGRPSGRASRRLRRLGSTAAFSVAAATGSRRTGIPLRKAIPARRSRSSGAALESAFTFAPPAPFARRQPPRCPQPCGTATVPGLISSVTFTGNSIAPSSTTRARALRPRARGARRRRDARGAECGRRASRAASCHPGVVRAQLAQPDQPHRVAGVARRLLPHRLSRCDRARHPRLERVVGGGGAPGAARRWRCARRGRCHAGGGAACAAKGRRAAGRTSLLPPNDPQQEVEQPLRPVAEAEPPSVRNSAPESGITPMRRATSSTTSATPARLAPGGDPRPSAARTASCRPRKATGVSSRSRTWWSRRGRHLRLVPRRSRRHGRSSSRALHRRAIRHGEHRVPAPTNRRASCPSPASRSRAG